MINIRNKSELSSLFPIKIFAAGTEKNRLSETVLFSIHSIYCYFVNNMDPDQTV